ncbi:hypothetical protein [Cellulomonas sp. URHE0023]|uniref:PH domain-containing protein n=1 Tax=Cellulomonas sp. URHE0023 TaxID=1380354 RepID=UPI000482CA19|nr:hypothetical protein [Cellulomonas sp. URHE0023]
MKTFRDGDLLWRERMSASTLLLGGLGVVLGAVVAGVGTSQGSPAYVVIGVALAWFSVVGSLLPVLEARSSGIYVRNVLHETWVPWADVVTVTPTSRVNVILGEGRFVGVWAVQHGAGRGLGRRSRIELAAERLLEVWPSSPSDGGTVVRRVSRSALAVSALLGVLALVLVVASLVG